MSIEKRDIHDTTGGRRNIGKDPRNWKQLVRASPGSLSNQPENCVCGVKIICDRVISHTGSVPGTGCVMRDAYAATSVKNLTGIMVGASRLGKQLRTPSPTISFNKIST